jgi:hypothetical protein
MIILVFISLFCLIQSNPIYEIKNCDIDESIDLDLKLIKGDWFELVRTNFIFNEKTWHNGFVTIFDKDSILKLNYSGVDKYFFILIYSILFKIFNDLNNFSSNNCQYAEISFDLNENSTKVLSYFNDTLIVYVCLNDSMCDLFVWSRKQQLNVSDLENQKFYKSLLDTYCLLNDENLIFSDWNFDICLNKTKVQEDNFFAIAEISSKQDLIELNQLLSNQTNSDYEINIELIENITTSTSTSTSTTTTTTTQSPFMPMNSIEEESLIESDNKDIMIIGLKKNGPNSKFDPIYIEIEAGSGDNELPELANQIGLKKHIQTNNLIFNDENTLDITVQMTDTSTSTTSTTEETATISVYQCPEIECHVTVCNFGHKKDENNCNTCDCLKNSSYECVSPDCNPCFYGSFTDVNGCDSCACKPRPKPKNVYECPKLDCPFCNYGSIKDEYGCETCICIRPNSLESSSYQCSAVPVCPFGACKHGSVLNDFGCQTCDCLKSGFL